MQLEWNGSCGGAPGGVPFWFTAAALSQRHPLRIRLHAPPSPHQPKQGPNPFEAVFGWILTR